MLNARIFSLGIFPNQHSIHIVVWSLISLYRDTRPNVSKKVERATKSQIERNMALADWIICQYNPQKVAQGTYNNVLGVASGPTQNNSVTAWDIEEKKTHPSTRQCSFEPIGWLDRESPSCRLLTLGSR
jgi:hypothetical protein